jgi:hypothetical protein
VIDEMMAQPGCERGSLTTKVPIFDRIRSRKMNFAVDIERNCFVRELQ